MALSRLALLFMVAMTASACGAAEDPAPRPPGSPPSQAAATTFRNVAEGAGFVGDAACFDCHEDQWRGYQEHGMARSYYPMTPENAVEDFAAAPLRHDATDFYYRAFEENGQFFQEEYRLDEAGTQTHRLVRQMAFVMGSGNAARTYFAESNGRLYELPLTWYAQVGRWDFSPGYQRQNGRFDRLVPERCMACHNSYPASVAYVEGKYAEVPHGIGCERCHGPGSLHVDARLASPEAEATIDETIVNPAHLDLERQLDVCQQCHLNGAVTVFREGRQPFDFRPSEALSSVVAMFTTEEPAATSPVTVISHADRMKRSACFRATVAQAEPMTCVTCHDPHQGVGEARSFNARCLGCHQGVAARFEAPAAQQQHAPTADCSGCHMPGVEAENAPHASFTDHWIRVVRPAAGVPQPLAAHQTLTPLFEQDREGPAARRYLGMAYLILGEQKAGRAATEKGIALLEEVLADDPDHGEAQFLLGRALLQQGRVARAIAPLERSVALKDDAPERLHALARAYEAGRRDPATIERLYRRALRLQPSLAEVQVDLARFLDGRERLDEAQVQYQQAAQEKPWSTTAHYGRGTVLLKQGRLAEAAEALQRVLALDPDHTNALINLAAVRMVEEQVAEAARLLERAARLDPNNVATLGNLGLVYTQLGRYQEARQKLQQVLALTPGDARAQAALDQITRLLNEAPEQ